MFADDPGRSIRNAASASELSYKLVRDILHKDINFKPWKPKSEDPDRRLEFAETMFELAERRHAMFSKVVWSDEAVVHLCGFIKMHKTLLG